MSSEKLLVTAEPTPWIIITVRSGEYVECPPVALIHVETSLFQLVRRAQRLVDNNPDIFQSPYGNYVQLSDFPRGCITFVQEEIADKHINVTISGDESIYVKKPSSKLLAYLQSSEKTGENHIEYCYLRIHRTSFDFTGYLKYGEGNDSMFETAEIYNSMVITQKRIDI